MKRRVLDDRHVGHSDDDKLRWLAKMKRYSLFGADQAGGSIQKARINMLLYGEDHSQLLKVDDSLTDPHLDRLIGKFDLLLTNPPFGSGKYDDPRGMAKMRDEVRGLELGWSWAPGNRAKRKELSKADPASLFIDRNLQLLKPGGRLLIVVPDGILCNYTVTPTSVSTSWVPRTMRSGAFLGGRAVVRAVVSLPTETFLHRRHRPPRRASYTCRRSGIPAGHAGGYLHGRCRARRIPQERERPRFGGSSGQRPCLGIAEAFI